MKKRLVIKPFIIPVFYIVAISTLVISFIYTSNSLKESEKDNDIQYVSDIIFDNAIPVISTKPQIVNPFTNEEVQIKRYFYDNNSDADSKKNSIIFYKNTYMPNTGVDYTNQNTFDIISVLDGTIISIKEDDMLGKTVEIRHNNELISVYQGLSEITVNEGDIIAQGQTIGKSGTSEINKDLGNHLHFELYHKGQIVDPLNYIGKNLTEIE